MEKIGRLNTIEKIMAITGQSFEELDVYGHTDLKFMLNKLERGY